MVGRMRVFLLISKNLRIVKQELELLPSGKEQEAKGKIRGGDNAAIKERDNNDKMIDDPCNKIPKLIS